MNGDNLRSGGVVVEKHVAIGIGYDVTEMMTINLGYAHGFEETILENSLSMVKLGSMGKRNA